MKPAGKTVGLVLGEVPTKTTSLLSKEWLLSQSTQTIVP